MINSSYKKDDVTFLLKDLTNIMPSTSIDNKEKLIAAGVNYSEMITDEDPVSEEINQVFEEMLEREKKNIARYVGIISDEIMKKYSSPIIVSLARAGTPIGILVKRYINFKYNKDVSHYSISIIREKGIDVNAINYIINKHKSNNLVFIDGWTGKGSITSELKKSIDTYNKIHNSNLCSDLVVLADPAKLSKLAGTKEDICIPNACLNSTVSGLVSRTIENKDYISDTDFHGVKVYDYLADKDFSNIFLDTIEKEFTKEDLEITDIRDIHYVEKVINSIMKEYNTTPDKIKLSIGESSRALIRRKPKIILIKDKCNPQLKFILEMAKEKNIEVKETNTFDYECIAILE